MNDINGGSKSSDAIKADIERTRSEMTEKIDTLQERLNPDTLKVQAQTMVQDLVQESADALMNFLSTSSQQAGRSALDMVKRNPLPAAVVGVGIGWMIMNTIKGQRSDSGYGSNYGRPGRTGDDRGYERGYNRYGSSDPMRNQSAMSYGMGGSAMENAAGYGGAYGYEEWDETSIYYTGDREQDRGMMNKMRIGAAGAAGRVGETAQDMAGKVGDTAQDVAGKVGDTAQGIAGKVGETAQGIVGKVGEAAQGIAGKVGDTAQGVAAPVADMGGQARHQAMRAGRTVARQAGNLPSQTQHQAMRMGQQAQRSIEDNPIAFGAAALLAGIAVGLALPATRQERQLLGDMRDQVIDKAQTMATSVAEDLKQVASDVAPRLQETAQKLTEDIKQTGKEATHEVKRTLQDAQSSVKEKIGVTEGDDQAQGAMAGSMAMGGAGSSLTADQRTAGTRQMSDRTSDWYGQERHPDDVDKDIYDDGPDAIATSSDPNLEGGSVMEPTSDDREE